MPDSPPSPSGIPRRAPSTGQPVPTPGRAAPPTGPPTLAGKLVHYGSIALIVLVLSGVVVSIPYLKRDPLVWDLTILFSGVTGAAAGATAGIVLVVFGGARRRRLMMVSGLVLGVASFVVLALTIAWAIHHDAARPA